MNTFSAIKLIMLIIVPNWNTQLIQAAHGAKSLLDALPPNRLQKFHLEFLDLRRADLTGPQADPTTASGSGEIDLRKFTNLHTLIVRCRPIIEDDYRLRETIASWKPTEVSFRTLILYTSMQGIWEGLWGDGDLEMSRIFADIVEETCAGQFNLLNR